MLMSSMMGAIAFQKDLGSVHACAHALGAVCDLHHGLANALMIDTVLDWNREAVPGKFAELSHAVDIAADRDGAAFIRWLRTLKTRIGITGGLAARGVTRAQLPQLVPLAAKDFTAQTNPRPTVEADYERFFLAAM
jgi:alcohol dehydrogenase class IV